MMTNAFQSLGYNDNTLCVVGAAVSIICISFVWIGIPEPVALVQLVQLVQPWSYLFLREKQWRCSDCNICVASPMSNVSS